MLEELERSALELKEKYGEDVLEDEDTVMLMRMQKKLLDESFEKKVQLEEEAKADAIHEIETKNKVLASLAQALNKQKSVLCDTKLTFSFDKGVKDVRASL